MTVWSSGKMLRCSAWCDQLGLACWRHPYLSGQSCKTETRRVWVYILTCTVLERPRFDSWPSHFFKVVNCSARIQFRLSLGWIQVNQYWWLDSNFLNWLDTNWLMIERHILIIWCVETRKWASLFQLAGYIYPYYVGVEEHNTKLSVQGLLSIVTYRNRINVKNTDKQTNTCSFKKAIS